MRIAICDDNVADRKQLERLLSRESDKRAASEGIVFTDSYGNFRALLDCPQQYDGYFVDLCQTPEITGEILLQELTARGVQSPVIFMCSGIDYRLQDLPAQVYFLDKPVKVAELSHLLDLCRDAMSTREPLIELRQEKDTLYVREKDILYAVEHKRMLHVQLTDGREAICCISNENFFAQVESFAAFLSPSPKVTLNGRYIQDFGFRKVIMRDSRSFKISPKVLPYARQIWEQLKSSDLP